MEDDKRLMSIDALRGFDMFFITGGTALIVALCKIFNAPDCWLAVQMRHVEWVGFAHHDTIFPLFLFLAGVSWPFSLASQEAKGRSAWEIHRKVIVRTIVLFLLEFMFGGILKFNPNFRLSGVLSFIGISWGVGALIFMHVRSFKWRSAIIAALLLGFWVLLRFTIAPDASVGVDSYSVKGCIVPYLDRVIWPNHLHIRGVYEPESLFSLAGGIALALIGMCSGAWLRNDKASPSKKAGGLACASVGFLLVDIVFILAMGDQIVKKLWTPSFVFSSAVYSTAMLALFYWIIDVKGCRRWTFYFRVVGMNSIFIYLMMRLGILGRLGGFFSEGFAKWAGAPWSSLISSVGQLAIGWVILYILYRHKTFFKV